LLISPSVFACCFLIDPPCVFFYIRTSPLWSEEALPAERRLALKALELYNAMHPVHMFFPTQRPLLSIRPATWAQIDLDQHLNIISRNNH
jgi:hypothetical protein